MYMYARTPRLWLICFPTDVDGQTRLIGIIFRLGLLYFTFVTMWVHVPCPTVGTLLDNPNVHYPQNEHRLCGFVQDISRDEVPNAYCCGPFDECNWKRSICSLHSTFTHIRGRLVHPINIHTAREGHESGGWNEVCWNIHWYRWFILLLGFAITVSVHASSRLSCSKIDVSPTNQWLIGRAALLLQIYEYFLFYDLQIVSEIGMECVTTSMRIHTLYLILISHTIFEGENHEGNITMSK